MTENNLTQLVGALGGWLEARPYGASQDALSRAARIVLDMRLLGVGIDEVDAPELAALDPEDRHVVEEARMWAQARREEARRRRVAEERVARQRRVAERESTNKTFAPAPGDRAGASDPAEPRSPRSAAYPRSGSGSNATAASPVASGDVADPVAESRATPSPQRDEPDWNEPDWNEPDTPAFDAQVDGSDFGAGTVVDPDHDDDLDGEDLFFFAEPQPGTKAKPEVESRGDARQAETDASSKNPGLADPEDHAFFTVEELRANTDQDARSWFRPDVVFKVVIVVWGIAAVGVVLVLLGMAFG